MQLSNRTIKVMEIVFSVLDNNSFYEVISESLLSNLLRNLGRKLILSGYISFFVLSFLALNPYVELGILDKFRPK